MTTIGIIAPTRELCETARRSVADLDASQTDVTIRYGNLEEGVAVAREMEADGIDVIISRGGTADMIALSEIRVPVVPINLSCQELSQAVFDAKTTTGLDSPRIALLSVKNMNQDVALFAQVLGADLRIYSIEGNEASIAAAITRVLADGADVVIGGTHSTRLAGEAGFRTILLPTSTDSIRVALSESIKLVAAVRLEQARTQRFRMLVNHMREGVLYVDEHGGIRIANPAAIRMLGLNPEKVSGKKVTEFLSAPGLWAGVESGGETVDEIVSLGDATFLASIVPAHVGHDLSGAIVTLQETNRITELDAKIRKDLRAKGLIATYRFEDIKGSSAAICETKRLAARYAATDSTILIYGETGTGKELFAQSIHNASRAANGPFVAVNCAALPPSLLESELFGYEEGAFTGANRKGKAGLFELAHDGTLFLDEISEMDQYGQVRLLRFLQEKQIMRLGGDKYLPVRVRVVAATNKDLRQAVSEGKFREDLFYRLKVLSLSIPPLRQRGDDIALLAKSMLAEWSRRLGGKIILSPDAWNVMRAHTWPGNVRELVNVTENLTVLAHDGRIAMDDVAGILHQEQTPGHLAAPAPKGGDEEVERIRQALVEANGRYSVAAKKLGMHRSTLYRKVGKHGDC